MLIKKCLCMVKRSDVGINWFVQKTSFKSTSRRRAHGNTFAQRKTLIGTNNSSSYSPLRFLANEANRKLEKTFKKLVLAIFQHFVFQTFEKPSSFARPMQLAHAQIQ